MNGPARRAGVWRTTAKAPIVAALVVAVAVLASACGSTSSDGSGSDQDSGDTSADPSGEAMNVLDAAAQADGTIVTVSGFLFDDTGIVYISELIAESFPPQPGGATLEVEGLAIDDFDGVNEEGAIRWLDEPVTITATLDSGKLVRAQRAQD